MDEIERFQVQSTIGKGSFGTVYRGLDTLTMQKVAIKIEPSSNFTIRQDIKILRQLRNKRGFPSFISSYVNDGNIYLVMELLGTTLHKQIKRYKKLDLGSILSIGLQLLESLENLHKSGYIHRDLKAQQILFDRKTKKNLFLVDFGLAKNMKRADLTLLLDQQSNGIIGNYAFASLNSHKGLPLSYKDDLESYVYLLIYMLKGQLPWQVKSNLQSDWQKQMRVYQMKVQGLNLFNDIPIQIQRIYNYLQGVQYGYRPDYQYIRTQLLQISSQQGVNVCIRWNQRQKRQVKRKLDRQQTLKSQLPELRREIIDECSISMVQIPDLPKFSLGLTADS